MTSITIPGSVTFIDTHAFYGSSGLTSVHISDLEAWCSILFNGSTTNPLLYANHLYLNGEEIKDLVIPNSMTSISSYAFYGCTGLTSITIPNSVTKIGGDAFCGCNLSEVISKIENPFFIYTNTFSDNTYNNATLYIPSGTNDKYKATEGWKNFYIIEEESGNGENPPEPSKCEKPTITFKDGKLTFSCATEGVTYQYSITASDVKNGAGNDIDFAPVYTITAYATKDGYENSEIATLEVSLSDSSIGIKDDVNGDGSVNAADVVKLVNIIIGLK